MDALSEAFKEWGALLMGVFGIGGWLARLEMRVVNAHRLAKDAEHRNATEIKSVETRIAQQRSEDLARQARAEDQLLRRMDEIGNDVKELLQRRAE